jgi:hypothetical protein
MDAEKLDEKILWELQLELRWLPEIDPRSVAVKAKVEAGVATLFGHVSEPSLRRVAETAARRVIGIRSVSNEIKIVDPSIETHSDAGNERPNIDASIPGPQNPG